jgi:iron complex transport system ATP-binding protein
MISAKNITCIKNSREILSDVSFSAKPNEVLAILGPNGAGKSTLLNIISGADKEYGGEVTYSDVNLKSVNSSSLALKRAVVSQKTNFQLPFTPLEIALMGRSPYNSVNKILDYQIAEKSLELTECSNFINQNYLTLSGGEQQRVQIARCLAQIAFEETNFNRFIMLDEPTSSLDIGKSVRLMNILKPLINNNLGIIWIVHDINLAIKYADKLLLLKDGKLFASGNTNEIATEERISELYELKLKRIELNNNEYFFHPTD